MQVKNIDELKAQIRPFLKQYLVSRKIEFSGSHFQCPNYKSHKNNDQKPAASFFPDDSHFNCFVCGSSGDIFSAAFYLENKPLKGTEFITENILYF